MKLPFIIGYDDAEKFYNSFKWDTDSNTRMNHYEMLIKFAEKQIKRYIKSKQKETKNENSIN